VKSFFSTASIALVITSFAFIVIAILYIYAPEPAREETLVTTPTVEVFALEQPNAPITRDLHAKVFADKDVDLFAFHNTTVESVEKRAGQFVKKGDVILRLDAKDIQLKLEKEISKQAQLEAEMKMQKQQVSQTKEKLEQQQKVFELSKKQFDRYKKLHQSKALSRQKLDEAQQSLERERKILIDLDHSVDTQKSKVLVSEKNSNQQQIAISQVKSSLEKTIIKAPFVGRVDKIYVNQGDDIKQGAV
jgi:HlyD family secretion protein